ncbi:MAG: WD40/YVTN/BNR-like repeat-containing protein [Myxococcaceae bacterium]
MRASLLTLALLLAACNTSVEVDPEGYRCDPGELCPPGYVCAAGVCRNQITCPNGACACDGVVCGAPPAAQCENGDTLRTFAPGVCNPADGTCSFAPHDNPCDGPCVDGACVSDPCLGVPCLAVPAAACASATILRVFSGACLAGVCSYPSNDLTCVNGCVAGRCKDQDLCTGVQCNNVPGPLCVSGKARTYTGNGTCDPGNGTCSYPYTETSCPAGCFGGACLGPVLSFTQTGPRVRHQVTALDQAPNSAGLQVLAVGPAGAASRWNGTAWTALTTGVGANLNSVWLASATSGWVVGDNKTLLRFDGTSLSPVTLSGGPAAAKLVSVHGNGESHVLVADSAGNLWRYNGTAWTAGAVATGDGPYVMASAFVDEAGHERIAGKCGSTPKACVAYSTTATSTGYIDVDTTSTEGFRSIGPSVDPLSSNYAIAGYDTTATVRRHKPMALSPYFDSTSVPSGLSGGAVLGVTEAATASGLGVYLLTARNGSVAGGLYRYTSLGGLDPAPYFDFWNSLQAMSRSDSGGVIVADSSATAATIVRRGVVTNQVLDLGEDWQAASFGSTGSLLLMNGDGDLATRTAGGWTFRRSPTASMYALAPGALVSLVAGAGGRVFKVSVTGYSALTSNTSSTLRAVCRVSDAEWYLVGDAGVLRGSDGYSVSSAISPTSADLTDVVCLSAKQAVAVGSGGTVLRLAGSSWQPISPAFPNSSAKLTSVAQSAQGILFVAGDGVFARFDGTTWTGLPSKPRLEHLQVFGPTDIYAIANGNEVVHFDGTSWLTKFTSSDPLLAGASAQGKAVFAGLNGALVEGQ